MHKTVIYHKGKTIRITLCAFCNYAEISKRCSCKLNLPEKDNCPEFSPVCMVSERFQELIDKLPPHYGEKN
ncbi:MAG: hypothetical protein RR626_06000 [Anaerovoracaceae bacterium]